MLPAVWGLFRRDLLIYIRQKNDLLNPILFLGILCTLFAIALGLDPNPKMLQTIAPAVIWVGVLLSYLLSLEKIFRIDFEAGALEQILLSPHSTILLLGSKLMAHWFVFGLPLILFVPIFGILLQLQEMGIYALFVSLLLGLPTLTCVGSLGVMLTLGLPRGGLLLSILILPLVIPILIIGASSVSFAVQGLNFSAHLSLLGAVFILSILLVPTALAWILRVSQC